MLFTSQLLLMPLKILIKNYAYEYFAYVILGKGIRRTVLHSHIFCNKIRIN